MIRIGVVSDTHIPERVPQSIMPQILKTLEGCDHIIHAGDIESQWVLDQLEQIAPVVAVRGDDEIDTVHLPEKHILEIGDVRIGIHHGHRPFMVELPSRINGYLGLRKGMDWGGIHQWLLDQFKEDPVNIIVFGHFHVSYSAYHDGILLFNPGSVFQLSYESLTYRMRHAHKPLRRLTSRIERQLKAKGNTTPQPTVGIITLHGTTISTEIIPLSPVNYDQG